MSYLLLQKRRIIDRLQPIMSSGCLEGVCEFLYGSKTKPRKGKLETWGLREALICHDLFCFVQNSQELKKKKKKGGEQKFTQKILEVHTFQRNKQEELSDFLPRLQEWVVRTYGQQGCFRERIHIKTAFLMATQEITDNQGYVSGWSWVLHTAF